MLSRTGDGCCSLTSPPFPISFQPDGELGERLLENKVAWADAILLVYSVTDRKSFDKLLDFYRALVPLKQKPVVVVVGNKSDLKHERQVSEPKGARLAENLKCAFVECSASEGHEKITDAFHELFRATTRRKKERRVSLSPRPLRTALGKVFRRNSSKNLLLTP